MQLIEYVCPEMPSFILNHVQAEYKTDEGESNPDGTWYPNQILLDKIRTIGPVRISLPLPYNMKIPDIDSILLDRTD